MDAAHTTSTTAKSGTTPKTVWRAYQGVSPSAVDEKDLIERHLYLVRNVVDRIKLNLPTHIDADDLYSVGITGLLAAVRKFDPQQGCTSRAMPRCVSVVQFSMSFAAWTGVPAAPAPALAS
jgi:RNA polymerase sigma factor for flagellar operon FliA